MRKIILLLGLAPAFALSQDAVDYDLWLLEDTGVFSNDVRVEPGGVSGSTTVKTHNSLISPNYDEELRTAAYWCKAQAIATNSAWTSFFDQAVWLVPNN